MMDPKFLRLAGSESVEVGPPVGTRMVAPAKEPAVDNRGLFER